MWILILIISASSVGRGITSQSIHGYTSEASCAKDGNRIMMLNKKEGLFVADESIKYLCLQVNVR